MSAIKTLSVSVKADVDQFTKGIDKARHALAHFVHSIPGGHVFSGLAMFEGVKRAGEGIVELTEHVFHSIDANGKLADRFGLTTENLIAYQHAAMHAGVSTEEMTGAFEKMLKNMPQGSDVAATFENVAKQITAIRDPAERAQAAIAVFGKGGQGMINALAQDFHHVREQVEQLNLAYSRTDASKIEEANRTVENLKAAVLGVVNQFAIGLAPGIQAIGAELLATDWKGWGARAAEAGAAAANGIRDFVADRSLELWIERAKAAWLGFKLIGVGVWEALKGGAATVAMAITQVLGRIQQAFEIWVGRWKESIGSLLISAGQAVSWASTSGTAGDAMAEAGGKIQKGGSEQIAGSGENRALRASENFYNKILEGGENLMKAADEYAAQAQKVADIQDSVTRNQKQGMKAADAVAAATRAVPTGGKVANLEDFMKDEKEKKVKEAKTSKPGAFKEIDTSLIKTGFSGATQEAKVKDPVMHKKTEKVIQVMTAMLTQLTAGVPVVLK